MRTKRTIQIAACALALAAPGWSAAEARTESKPYVGSAVVSVAPNCALGGNLQIGENPDTGVGGVCFAIQEGDTRASFTIDDVSPLPVGGEAFFLDGRGGFMGSLVLFCGSGTIDVLDGAAWLAVEPDVIGVIPCLPSASAVGTTGTISVTFS